MDYYYFEQYIGPRPMVISTEPMLEGALDSWLSGERFSVNVPEPLVFTVDKEDEGDVRSIINIGSYFLISNDLEKVLRGCGVTNFDSYAAEVKVTRTREVIPYRVINIIGKLSATDHLMSKGVDVAKELGGGVSSYFFSDLVLSGESVRGLKMFRLAENITQVFISGDVKRCINDCGFEDLESIEFDEVKVTELS